MSTKIRNASLEDIPELAVFWYDQIALALQKHQVMGLAPDAVEKWAAEATATLYDPAFVFLAAESQSTLIGGLMARIHSPASYFAGETVCEIYHVIVDLHTPHQSRGIGRLLVEELRQQMRTRGIMHITVHTPANSVFDDALWLALGAVPLEKIYYFNNK